MTDQEKKQWILKRWRTSSGVMITEMLLHYFLSTGKTNIIETAKNIFGTKIQV